MLNERQEEEVIAARPHYDLFGGTPPHEAGSDTSRAAAEMLTCRALARMAQRVYDAIRDAGRAGITDDEIERVTGMKHQSASARRRELVLRGIVRDSGMRELSPERRPRTLWVLVP